MGKLLRSRTSASKPKPVLVTLLPPRAKYLHGVGSLSEIADTFAEVIDASPICSPSEFHERHTDVLNENDLKAKVSLAESVDQLEALLRVSRPTYVLVYALRHRTHSEDVLRVIQGASRHWGLLATKLGSDNFTKVLRPSLQFEVRRRRALVTAGARSDQLVADHLFTNSSINARAELDRLHVRWRRRIRVRHIDALSGQRVPTPSPDRTGLFLDQGLPWNSEAEVDGTRLWLRSADDYLEVLSRYLEHEKRRHDLDEISVALHPNAAVSPLADIGFQTHYGRTREFVLKSSRVFGHFSQSLSLAVQVGVPTNAIDFQPGFSEDASRFARGWARTLGINLGVWEAGRLRTEQVSHIERWGRRTLVRRYHAADAPSACKALKRVLADQ